MGQLKRLIPKSKRPAVTEMLKSSLPEGFIRNHAADAVTVGGLSLMMTGAKIDGRIGMTMRIFGKFGDDIDGDLARTLGTTGRFGAILDTFVDKAGVAIEIPLLWRHAMQRETGKRTAHQTILSVIAAKHATNATLNGIALARKRTAESSKMGKINAYVDGMTAGFLGIAGVAKSDMVRAASEISAYTFFAGGLVVGGLTAAGYAREALGPAAELDLQSFQTVNSLSWNQLVIPPRALPIAGLE